MSDAHASTQEEIEARRAEIAAAKCVGDGIHGELRDSHDWRLWKREPRYIPDGASFGSWPLEGFTEQWYCTRCRKFEERVVPLEGVD